MRRLSSILFATDFRPASGDAVGMAARLAGAFGAQVHVLHVLEVYSESAVADHFRCKLGDVLLEDVRGRFAEHGVQIAGYSIGDGPIADSIIRQAAKIGADLIVLGAGENSEDRTFHVGPIAQAVMEHAPQPVLAVRPGTGDAAIQTILCPVDHSSVSRRGLRNAIQLAKCLGARLVVLSVVPEVGWLTAAVETGELTDVKLEYEEKWCEELDAFLGDISFDGVPHVQELKSGVPHDQIIAAAKQHQADLLVMGATGRTGLVRMLLGSTTRRILRDPPCSLLTVKEEDVVAEPDELGSA